ncbi:MAG: hypothetical protein IJD35_02180 [Clostridia bacterium]|nr:hypothetical protein [Clostridia bacterium]
MKNKISFIFILILIAMLLGSCANTPDLPQDTEPPTSFSSTETLTETPPNTEPPTSDSLTEAPAETPADPFESLRSSGEEWISYGLAAYEGEKQVENLKEFFSDRANLTYLTLYDHLFTYDKEKTVPAAEALFAFIYNEYGVEALLDLDKRCEYKTAYLQSLGLDLEYGQDLRVETFLASMEFSSNAIYKYIITFDNVTYYFKDFSAGAPAEYHGFLYYSTTGLFELIEYIKSNNLSEGLNTDRKFNYFMTLDGSGYSQTLYSNGNMYINGSDSTLHEAVHAMGVTQKDNIWLSEGLCNYFGRSLGFNDLIASSYIQILTLVKQGYFDERANAGDTQAILYKQLYEEYAKGGGQLDSVHAFDFRLYFDISAKMELESEAYVTLGEAYKVVNKTECNAIGNDISYAQATSLVQYLADTYGIEKVLDAYHSQDIETALGKGYEELKTDWLAYLYK